MASSFVFQHIARAVLVSNSIFKVKMWKYMGPWTWMLELVAKSLSQDNPMDAIQVGKAVFVKESYTTLGIEPRTYSNPGRSGNHLVYSWVIFSYPLTRHGCSHTFSCLQRSQSQSFQDPGSVRQSLSKCWSAGRGLRWGTSLGAAGTKPWTWRSAPSTSCSTTW